MKNKLKNGKIAWRIPDSLEECYIIQRSYEKPYPSSYDDEGEYQTARHDFNWPIIRALYCGEYDVKFIVHEDSDLEDYGDVLLKDKTTSRIYEFGEDKDFFDRFKTLGNVLADYPFNGQIFYK